MKENLKISICAFWTIIVSMACSDNILEQELSPLNTKSIEKKERFEFKYKDKYYSEEYDIIDSTMVFANLKIADLICDLENDPYIATLNYPNGMVEYFDSNEELESRISENNFSFSSYGLDPVLMLSGATLTVYEAADFGGRKLTYSAPYECPDLNRPHNEPMTYVSESFNDIISSFQLSGSFFSYPCFPSRDGYGYAVVTFYEDYNYAYGSATFILSRDNQSVSHNNFKKVKRCKKCKYNMNDRTSSFRFYLSNVKPS